MKVLIHGPNYSPEIIGIGKYTGEMAQWLAKQGHQVRVVTAPPYYPEWEIKEGYSGNKYMHEEKDGVFIWRCPIWVPKKRSGLKRLIHLASFALSSSPVMLRQIFWRPDVVIVIEPPLFCAPQALLVARLSGSKAWMHIQDFEIDAAFELGLLSNKTLRSIVTFIEKGLMKSFDKVSTISDRMLETLINKGLQKDKCVLFPNWINTDLIYPLNRESPLRKELGIPDNKYIALYSGNMGEKQGLEVIIETARLLQTNPDILFIMCGDGASRQKLAELGKECKNILWLPLQPLEKLNELLNLADVHLLPQKAGIVDLVMPSKLSGMLASGKPVVGMGYPETQVYNIVKNCGLVIEPGNSNYLAEAINSLYTNPDSAKLYGKAAREFAKQNWSHEVILHNFEKDL